MTFWPFWCIRKHRMVALVRGRPFSTTEPKIIVDAGLPPGSHRFQLEVIDDAGLRSAPATASVLIARGNTPPGPQPSPPIRAVTPRRTTPRSDSGSNR